MKNFIKTPFGLYPSDWKLKRLGEISKVVTGNTPKTSEKENFGAQYPWVTPSDLNGKKYISTSSRGLSKTGLSKVRLLPPNSILVTCIASIGKNVILTTEGSCNQQINAIHPSKEFHSEYLYYILEACKPRLKALAGTTAVPIINKSTFESFPVVLPPLCEQGKIADILSTVDEKIEVLDQQILETEELKNGLMQRLLTEGIGHTEWKDSPLGRIPKNWEVSTLETHSAFITKGSTPTTYGFNWEDEGILFLRSECVGKFGFSLSGAMYISEAANDQMERSKIKGGDILMTITGNVGKVCIYPEEYKKGNINQHIARIRIEGKEIVPSFMYHYLSQGSVINNYSKITTGQAYPQLSLKQVRETMFPLSPRSEQVEIARVLNITDDKLKILLDKKVEYQILKKGLMQKLLTGRVRVNNPVEA